MASRARQWKCCESEVSKVRDFGGIEIELSDLSSNQFNGPLVFLNTSIITSPGGYTFSESIPLSDARLLVRWFLEDWNCNVGDGIESAIGHQATAELLTTLLGAKIEFNRQKFEQRVNQLTLVLKLNDRVPEGVVLSLGDIEKIGYKFHLLLRSFVETKENTCSKKEKDKTKDRRVLSSRKGQFTRNQFWKD